MAKVKIQGNASGTGVLTVTAPNTSTDRTITLPDATSTLFTDAGGTLTGNTTIATNSVPLLALKRTGNNAGNGYIECHGADDSVDYAIRFAQTNGVMSFDNGGSRIMGVTADGLTFGTDTAAANALDDYEEGTFTATIKGTVSDPSTAVTTTGYYTKIGNVVQIAISFDNKNTTGASGNLEMTGLPFTSGDLSTRYPVTTAFYSGFTWADDRNPRGFVPSNSNTMYFYSIKSAAIWTQITHNPVSSGAYLWISGTYRV